MRANGGKPIALQLVPGLIPDVQVTGRWLVILNVVSGNKCYKTRMYPVNVYSFTPTVTLQTHCTCGPTRKAHTKKWLHTPRSTTSQSSNATLARQKHIRLQSLSFKQVVGSHWPSEDINPIAGCHICKALRSTQHSG